MRNKFSDIFDQAMRVQLVLKGICTDDEWKEFKEHIYYDYIKDNNFAELKEAELTRERLTLLQQVDPYTGRYYSMDWIRRNVLRLDDKAIENMEDEIARERKEGITYPSDIDQQQQQAQLDNTQAQTDQMAAQAQATASDAANGDTGADTTPAPQKSSPKSNSTKGDLNLAA